jgi:predicted ATP-grasp superfamily ATP-dependent carboligase
VTAATPPATGDRPPPRAVAVFDVDLPTGVAFVRSLGRKGVPVIAYSPSRRSAGAVSRFVTERRWAPPVYDADRFTDWLAAERRSGAIDLVAPTSDYVAFALAELGDGDRGVDGGPSPAAVRACLYKQCFAEEFDRLGFPVPAWATPTSLPEALAAAADIGFPLVLKPRTHAGVGVARGAIARDPDDLRRHFVPYPLDERASRAVAHDAALAWPLMQAYRAGPDVEVVSVSGCLGADGSVLAVSHCRKVGQWPLELGIGTRFEAVGPQPFTDAALEAVRRVLGSGLFELEVLIDRRTGAHWAIDLNPRAFGQLSLDIALGRDLPSVWYQSVTGTVLPAGDPPRGAAPVWYQGVPFYVGALVRAVEGPQRRRAVTTAARMLLQRRVGALHQWGDPLPGLVFAANFLKHPRALVRQLRVSQAERQAPR